MSLFKGGAAVLIAALLGGCVSAPEQIADNAAQAQGVTGADEAAIAAGSADLEPIVVDAAALVKDSGVEITCRDMLQTASNTMRTRCMTRDDWKRFEQAEARQAAETVRRMQGDPFP